MLLQKIGYVATFGKEDAPCQIDSQRQKHIPAKGPPLSSTHGRLLRAACIGKSQGDNSASRRNELRNLFGWGQLNMAHYLAVFGADL